MVERICPCCEYGNPITNQFCGQCGSSLERQLPARVPQKPQPIVIAGRELPLTMRQVSQGLAISLAAIVAEAGLNWLRNRSNAPTALATQRPTPPPGVTTIVSQRVLEVWECGELTRKLIERSAWVRHND